MPIRQAMHPGNKFADVLHLLQVVPMGAASFPAKVPVLTSFGTLIRGKFGDWPRRGTVAAPSCDMFGAFEVPKVRDGPHGLTKSLPKFILG